MTNPRPRRYRAPVEDGAALIDPPLSQVGALVESNRAKLAEFDRRAGFPSGWRQAARTTALRASGFEANEQSLAEAASRPLILTGHQPELFHPGVWLKNFIATSIAKSASGTAVNLRVDSDTIRRASIGVPTRSPGGEPSIVDVPFDLTGPELPWEMRRVLDESIFRKFPTEVHQSLRPHSPTNQQSCLLDRLWPHVLAAAEEQFEKVQRRIEPAYAGLGAALPDDWIRSTSFRQVRMAQCLGEGRQRLEREIGLATRELPVAAVSRAAPFHLFVDQALSRHRELHSIYNAALAEYRLLNHIRGHLRPVPTLSRDGDWYEIPFWLWTFGSTQRHRAFARRTVDGWEMSDRQQICFHSRIFEGVSSPSLQLTERDIVLRPRALVTTMYARLVLSDLFIHGIGGAKYDELTDEIIRRFFGIEPPAYLTATATFRLPIDRPQVTSEDVRECVRRIRDLRYRPESFVADPLLAHEPQLAQQLQSLAAEKRQYVRTHVLRRGSEAVFAGVDRINRTMHELLRPVEEHLRREHARLVVDARRARVLGSREFSFVLFPEDYLVPRLLELARVPA